MAPTAANNNTPDQKPTGDLEHLFRQKFAEAEVAPRAGLWEQLDHELLVQQNETYRRRLLLHRWVAAACLLLMAGGGTWFSLQPNARPGTATQEVATTAVRPGTATSPPENAAPAPQFSQPDDRLASTDVASAASQAAPSASADSYLFEAAEASGHVAGTGHAGRGTVGAGVAAGAYSYAGSGSPPERSLGMGRYAESSQLGSALLQDGYAARGTVSREGQFASAGAGQQLLAVRTAALPLNYMAMGRPEKLPLNQELAASNGLAAAGTQEEDSDETLPAKPRRWKFNAAYAATAFNPNANFSRNATGQTQYNALVRNRADAYEAAAAEYRQNLQAGLGQHFALAASYSLSDNWDVQAGLEVGQQRASSASSWYFMDGNSTTADYFSLVPPITSSPNVAYQPQLRSVDYRYRTASLPVNVRYTSNQKHGLSLYARLGAAVNVLLSSRTELQGVPEATRVYNLSSTDSPYRKLTGSVRGGAGLRYQPGNSSWSVALGPDLEAGVTSLNTQPAQSFMRQSRPYAIGVEASVEFGSPRVAKPIN